MADAAVQVQPAIPQEDPLRGRAGVAPIKPEFVLPREIAESSRAAAAAAEVADDDAAEGREDRPDNKRQKTKKGWKARNAKAKSKPTGEATVRICKAWENTGECSRGTECKYQHSWAGYFEVKPKDIHVELKTAFSDSAPFVNYRPAEVGGEDALSATIDLATQCPVYADIGYCTYGWRCRFLGGHVRKVEAKVEEPSVSRIDNWELFGQMPARDTASQEGKHKEINWPKGDVIHQLKTNQYPWKFTTRYLAHIEPHKPFELALPKGALKGKYGKHGKKQQQKQQAKASAALDEEDAMNGGEEDALNGGEEAAANGDANGTAANEEEATNDEEKKGVVPGEAEAMDVPLRPEEKRRLNWDNGLYLAPLTTVGNLPFRRVCVDYGASITISEMALAQPLITGQAEEWALVRRHESEKMFGVQLAGGFANRMVPAAELLAQELGPSGVDFVDVNMGCPIDLLFNQGAGSALMDNPGRLGKILVGMNRALGEIPLTVKFRTGVAATKPNAHKLIPRFATEWGASAMTLHGRSRQQRYSKLADWSYVRQCVDVLRETVKDAGMAPIPIFGNGDCFSAQAYWEEKERSGVDGVMVARGALIKPWIFTEIAERREWDISATERLEGIRKFAEYGLSHWGSDSLGVNTTRRFLLEALSFQHRYIPIGLLERMPPMLNERPPAYKGRNELETLLASPYVGDWIKISEMFLGPVAEGFTFLPKHKSNAFGSEEAQG